MIIPRWTVYPALTLIAAFLVAAIPEKVEADPYAGAAAAKTPEPFAVPEDTEHPQLVILGIDGMDPDLLQEVVALYPELMPNFRWLIEQGDGIQSLATSTPPQSPVAWSNFITGLNPGGHGIFDFLHRDLMTRGVLSSSDKAEAGSTIDLPGPWFLPVGGSVTPNRTGEAFWSILKDNGVPADIWRMPANFPVTSSKGLSFPGMLTPAVDSSYGQCSFYTTDPDRGTELKAEHPGNAEKITLMTERGGTIATSLRGPKFAFKHYDESDKNYTRLPMTVYVDRGAEAVAIEVGSERVILQPGEWSHFIEVSFEMVPFGLVGTQGGICRFYLRSIEPHVEFYVSPINVDPEAPIAPVSEPEEGSADLAAGIGKYYTQGMAEDVNSLKNEVLTDAEFMAQVDLVYSERRDMLDYAIDRYQEDGDGGLLFFYFSTVDLSCHMMWRHRDTTHPAHDPVVAQQDSSWWSGRAGTTWKDTVHDLYIKMDPVLGRIRERMGEDGALIVMSDHGFAPYRRKFSINTWLLENGYLVLHDGMAKQLPRNDPEYKKVVIFGKDVVDWSKTRAYGIGFNGLYLNLAGREQDNPDTTLDESGIVKASEAEALLRDIKGKLEAIVDDQTGVKPILRCDLAIEVYTGARVAEAPDILVGFNAGYGNSDPASLGQIPNEILSDNTGGGFNGSHLMAPEVVSGILISNKPIRTGAHRLQDLTVEVLDFFGIDKPDVMTGHPVLERSTN